MQKLLLALPVLSVAACVDNTPAPRHLADLPAMQATVLVRAQSPRSVTVDLTNPAALAAPSADTCPAVDRHITAALGDVPATIAPGGLSPSFAEGDSCDAIQLRADLPDDAVAGDSITLSDATATWTIELPHAFDDELDVTPAFRGLDVTWKGAPKVDAGMLDVVDGKGFPLESQTAVIHDNVLTFGLLTTTARPATLDVWAQRKLAPARCDGPITCDVTVYGGFSRPL